MRRRDLYRDLGERVRSARRARGLSQEQLGRAVHLSRTSVTNLEAGNQRLQLDTLYDIAEALGCNPQTLLPDLDIGSGLSPDAVLPAGLSQSERDWISAIVGLKKGDDSDESS